MIAQDKTLYQSLLNQTVVNVINLLKAADIHITKATIRSELVQQPNYPAISLAEIGAFLNKFKIEHIIGEAPKESLSKLVPPLLCQVAEQTDAANEVFVVVTKVSKNGVTIRHPNKGMIKMGVKEFQELWTGIVVAITSDELVEEDNYEEKSAIEQTAEDEYRKSIEIEDAFLSKEECDLIIEHCVSKNLFGRSATGKGEVSDYRTSFSGVINERETGVFERVLSRVAKKNGWPVDQIEDLQCVRYLPGQQFKTHFDADDNYRRGKTVLIYLNDDFEGGKTYFPEVDLLVEPKTGRAITFNNLDRENEIIPFSVHAGLPVSSGTKYACNVWMRI